MKQKYCIQSRYTHHIYEIYLQTINNIHILIENSVRNIFDQTATFLIYIVYSGQFIRGMLFGYACVGL